MKVEETTLDGVLLITPEPFSDDGGEFFEDSRGMFIETYNKEEFKKHGIDIDFVQDDFSRSKKDVLRGIHGDDKTWKLISCPVGKIFFVVVDCNEESENFGKWESFDVNESNHLQVLIPPMYGNGHLALTDKIMFKYKQSEYYDPKGQFSYRWDEPKFGIDWPVEKPILSKRDEQGAYAEE